MVYKKPETPCTSFGGSVPANSLSSKPKFYIPFLTLREDKECILDEKNMDYIIYSVN